MLEKLAGRLTWERTPHGIRVVIPSRRGPMAGLLGPLLGICLVGAWFLFWSRMEKPAEDTTRLILILHWIRIGACAGAVCALLNWLLWAFTARTVLTVDPTEARIERGFAGLAWHTRSFATCGIGNLKYIPAPPVWSSTKDADPTGSEIQFQADHRTHSFAAGITETEAAALIARMSEIYLFPQDQTPVPIMEAH